MKINIALILIIATAFGCSSSKPSQPRVGNIIAPSHHAELNAAMASAEKKLGIQYAGSGVVVSFWQKPRAVGVLGIHGGTTIGRHVGLYPDFTFIEAEHEMGHAILSSRGIKSADEHHRIMREKGFKF